MITLMVILAIFIFALWVLLPVDSERFGRQGIRLGLDLQGGIHLVYKADLSQVEPDEEADVIDGVIAVISNRINPLGVTEPVIQKQGHDRIAVELPGLSITDKEKERLSRVALLKFGELADEEEEATWENARGRWKPATAIINGQEKELTSRYFKENTYVDRDNMGNLLLIFEWDEEGSEISEAVTGRLINQPLGIFEGDESLLGEDGRPIAPIVRSMITAKGPIEGLSYDEATSLSNQ